jgi:hypothetical protein
VLVDSLGISLQDLGAALTEFHPCPETLRRSNARRHAVDRDGEVSELDQVLFKAESMGDTVEEAAARLRRDVSVRRSVASWVTLVQATFVNDKEWYQRLEALKKANDSAVNTPANE